MAAARLYRRFLASTRGVVAIEFAGVLPILLIMFLATYDGGRALAIYMKVRSATFTVDAVTNQYTTIANSDMTTILGATSQVLAPYSATPVTVVISQISINSKGVATVSWSDTLNGTARAIGSSVTLPSTLTPPNAPCGSYPCYVILGEVSYKYTPMFGFFMKGSSLTLSDSLYVTPRSSTCVLRPPQSVTSC